MTENSELAIVRAVLKEGADRFRKYEQYHKAKGTEDSLIKANKNRAYAESQEFALSALSAYEERIYKESSLSANGEMVNFFCRKDKALERFPAICNGVLVQYIEDADEDGICLRPVVSVVCKDKALESDLLFRAKELINAIRGVGDE